MKRRGGNHSKHHHLGKRGRKTSGDRFDRIVLKKPDRRGSRPKEESSFKKRKKKIRGNKGGILRDAYLEGVAKRMDWSEAENSINWRPTPEADNLSTRILESEELRPPC